MLNVHVFSSQATAFFVNSFLLETPNGLILVDTQFLTSPAQDLLEVIRSHGKPLIAVLITHPHPDHFNGTAVIADAWPGVPIYATKSTIDVINATAATKREAWTPVYGDDYPKHTVVPDLVVESGRPLVIDGAELHIDDLGAGESADIVVVHLPQTQALIASDLLYHHVHPWLAEGRTHAWLAQIDIVRERYGSVKTVFAGHGKNSDLDALLLQAEYLNTFRSLVSAEVSDLSQPTAAEKQRIAQAVLRRYPGYPLEMLIEMTVDGVARELAGEMVLLQ